MITIRQSSRIPRLTRFISISQSPPTSTGTAISSTTTSDDNIKDVEMLVSENALETAEFKALGNPQTVLAINSPPSVPVHIRRGSLLSIYGLRGNSSITSVRSTLQILNPVKRLIYGGFASSYQKLISTTQFSILVSSTSRNLSLFKKSDNKSFVNVVVDGTNDWAILNKHALQVYSGNSLTVGMYKLPQKISKKLAKQLKVPTSTSTGLFKWTNSGYTLLTGRGQVGLVGNGSIYNVNLSADEELLINRHNLVGITVNGPFDLQNCIVKYSFPISGDEVVEPEKTRLLKDISENSSYLSKVSQYWAWFMQYFSVLTRFTSNSKRSTYNFLVGNQEFIRVVGPRNILLQSNTENTHIAKPRATPIKPADPSVPARKASDYLSYVTVQSDKGVVFESTPDFKKSIERIEKKI